MRRQRAFTVLAARRSGRKRPQPRNAGVMAALEHVTRSIAARSDAQLRALPQQSLEDSWFFRWDATASLEYNLYQFFDLLDLYARKCERWEHLHGGHVCLVERVRDGYVLPKI